MDFQQIIERTRKVCTKCVEVRRSKYGRRRSGSELALRFVNDVGDLAHRTGRIEKNLRHQAELLVKDGYTILYTKRQR